MAWKIILAACFCLRRIFFGVAGVLLLELGFFSIFKVVFNIARIIEQWISEK